jgi:hypothetical protein
MSTSTADDDWRLRDQERYIGGAMLHRATYHAPSSVWDHDHCEFCWAKFMDSDEPEILREGYVTDDGRDWVCPQCFEDFRERFGWTIRETD